MPIYMPLRPGDRAQASPDTTEAQAECERHLSQVSARGGPGALSPHLFRVQRCSGSRSTERSAVPLAAHAPGPGRPDRTRSGRGAGAPEPRSAKRHTAPQEINGRWSPNAIWWGAIWWGAAGRLSPRKGLSLHGAGASATPRSTLQSWATAGLARPAVKYVGLPPGAWGEPP
ncbi:hypothetical protein NDU88_005311 [Pleurodeles waltl]|uniref:Uncharacterized protein n=1 Tax=Pleurodeles waltl TaxID=8319 RepID=A0AAV7TAB9_PLEWA|nr:hypothetical protein NDU88_005311 [Pleurodeles waltl]